MVLPVIKQTISTEILNLEGHLNHCIGSKVTAILLNGWILPTGGVASGRVCHAAYAAGVFMFIHHLNINPTSPFRYIEGLLPYLIFVVAINRMIKTHLSNWHKFSIFSFLS